MGPIRGWLGSAAILTVAILALAGRETWRMAVVFAFVAGVSISAFSARAAQGDVAMSGFTPDAQARILKAFPAMASCSSPSGGLAARDCDRAAVSPWNFAIVHKGLPESLAYEITRLAPGTNDGMVRGKGDRDPRHPGVFRRVRHAVATGIGGTASNGQSRGKPP